MAESIYQLGGTMQDQSHLKLTDLALPVNTAIYCSLLEASPLLETAAIGIENPARPPTAPSL
jgi:hypothetical protein